MARKKTIKTGAEGAKVKPLKDLQTKKDVKGGLDSTHHIDGTSLLDGTHH